MSNQHTVQGTTNYSIFKKLKGNRPLRQTNVSKLVKSIQKNNLLHARPILVDQNMQIVDGQHRLEAAKILKEPVYYMIVNDLDKYDMIDLNRNQANWTVGNMIDFYALDGNETAQWIIDLSNKYKIPAAGIMGVFDFRTVRLRETCYHGFPVINADKIDVEEKILIASEIINHYRPTDRLFVDHMRKPYFIRALSLYLTYDKTNRDIFLSQQKKYYKKLFVSSKIFEIFRSMHKAYCFSRPNQVPLGKVCEYLKNLDLLPPSFPNISQM